MDQGNSFMERRHGNLSRIRILLWAATIFILAATSIKAATVMSTLPVQNANDVSAGTDISVTFEVDMNPGTITESSFVVRGLQAGKIAGTIGYDAGNYTATFVPDDDFVTGEMVSVTLTTDIQTAQGDPLEGSFSWDFNVASTAGTGTFYAETIEGAGTDPIMVRAGDIDNDGDMDLVAACFRGDSVAVCRNQGDGDFAPPAFYGTGGNPRDLVLVDFDDDGALDLVMVNQTGSITFLHNNGDGTFAFHNTIGLSHGPQAICAADFNGDGFPDLAAARNVLPGVTVLLNDGAGNFPSSDTYEFDANIFDLASADIDNDGDIDIMVTEDNDNAVQVLRNNDNEFFYLSSAYAVGYEPWLLTMRDFNGDGFIDLAVNNHSDNSITVLANDGNPAFSLMTELPTGNDPFSIVSGDFDADGDHDLAYACRDNHVGVYLNNGDGTFYLQGEFGLGDEPRGIFPTDVNSDGDIDLAVAVMGSNQIAVLRNTNCTVDSDGDGYGDPGYPENECPDDNCPDTYNPDQSDFDADGIGDLCDECTDSDGDGYGNPGYAANTCLPDNCPDTYNPDQSDGDMDGIGDACDGFDALVLGEIYYQNNPQPVETLYVGGHYKFTVSIRNGFVLGGMSLGFHVWSDDGATWNWLEQPDGVGMSGYVSLVPGCRLGYPDGSAFDMTKFLVTEQNVDEIAPDTLLVGGVAMAEGVQPGPLEKMFMLHFNPNGPYDPGQVRTICFDSSFVPPSACAFCFVDVNGLANMAQWGGRVCLPVKLLCGNPNGDNDVNVGDAVFMINYVFRDGPPPDPWQLGDANCDGILNVGDIVYLIAASFRYGPQPECCEY